MKHLILAGVAGCLLSLAATAEAQTIRFSTAGPPPDFLARSLEEFAGLVAAADVGLTVETYPGSSLFQQGSEVPALQRGNLEMSTMTTFEIAAQIPELGFLNRAYLFRDYDHMMRAMTGPLGDEIAGRVAEEMGIEILAVVYLGTRQVNLRTARDVVGPDDLAGVKMRMPASPEWLLLGETLGVEPTPMAMSEVYIALQTGTVDGQENPLTIMNAARYYEVTQQVVLTSHLVQPVFYAVAQPFFQSLTDEQRDVLRAAALEAAAFNNDGRYADEQQVVERLRGLGLRVDEIDLSLFQARADAAYAVADLAEPWDLEMMEAIRAVE